MSHNLCKKYQNTQNVKIFFVEICQQCVVEEILDYCSIKIEFTFCLYIK